MPPQLNGGEKSFYDSIPRHQQVLTILIYVDAQIEHNLQRESRTCAKDNVVYYLPARRRHLEYLHKPALTRETRRSNQRDIFDLNAGSINTSQRKLLISTS